MGRRSGAEDVGERVGVTKKKRIESRVGKNESFERKNVSRRNDSLMEENAVQRGIP